ncbi:hypothetical protein [Parapedobacter indicus]|uniref:Uncharacterized protein n=1 Tax=Parapedobacter indicus TaxID=1477437 RepID=A0A1I3CN04_9SPHI|nr:hypothetical protein [Parapedobacter indicus]PPL04317.1 hypothetical protein CLV26_101118 [Parapedobacter indicus]SFH75768.1 hypothetical protein SAMN05444682_101105 [Parapedobacter indicus]
MMATLFEKLALFLDGTHGFRYIRYAHRIEVWLSAGEELPIVVSNIGPGRYIISSGNLTYEVTDGARAYRYLLRVFFNMDGTSIDYTFIRRSLHSSR